MVDGCATRNEGKMIQYQTVVQRGRVRRAFILYPSRAPKIGPLFIPNPQSPLVSECILANSPLLLSMHLGSLGLVLEPSTRLLRF
jgi:hypothetical protein